MSRLSSVSAAAVALGVAGAAAFGLAVPAASGADSDGSPVVSNRETVNVKMDASGQVQVARVYDQIAVSGQGTVEITNPVGEQDLRNLDGLGTPSVSDGAITTTLEVDGEAQQRTVSTFDGQIPVDVQVRYVLDGAEVTPEQLVGATGELEVSYRVENVTGTPTEISFKDGRGEDVSKTVDVVTPLIGSLTTTLPERFTQITSGQANVTGDGRGNTRLTFTMTLIPPIGSAVAEFGYTTYVRNGLVPFANISLVPVKPFENPTLSNAANSYQGGADTGQQLTDGAAQIDENVLKLADGAGELLAGVLLLQEGSLQLQDGLAGEAAPGAAELATGVGQLDDGAQRLSDGAARLADGAGQLDDGAGQLSAGLSELAAGLGLISGGLDQLAGVDGLPAAQDGLKQVRRGLTNPKCNLANPTDPANPCGVQQVLGLLALGASNPACDLTNPTSPANPCGLKEALGLTKLGVSNPACDLTNPTNPANPCGVRQVVNFVAGQLSAAAANGGDIDQLRDAAIATYVGDPLSPTLAGAPRAGCPTNPGTPVPPVVPPDTLVGLGLPANDTCVLLARVAYGLGLPAGILSPTDPGGLKAQTAAAGAGLAQVVVGVDAKLLPGIEKMLGGATTIAAGASGAQAAVKDLLVPGVNQIIRGLGSAIDGVDQLDSGAASAVDGANQLDAGASQLAAGTGTLADGSEELADGASQLADGTSRASDGAARLADGLGAAADGSGQLADGLGQAADGVTQIEDGANRLSDEGTSQLVAAGNATALDFGEKYALIAAAAETTADGGLPFGAPEGAIATAAYSIDILAESGQSGKNVTRGIIALVLALGAAAGAFVLAQRA